MHGTPKSPAGAPPAVTAQAPPSPPASTVHPAAVHLTLLTVSMAFGVHFVGVALVLDAVPARAWAFWRLLGATLVLAPLAWRAWRRPGAARPSARVVWLLLPASLLGVTLNQALFAVGLEHTTPAHSAVIMTSVPVLVLAFAAAVGQERLTAVKVTGVVLALAGVLTLLEADVLVFGAGGFDASTAYGDLLTIANAACFSVYLVWMRKLGRDVDALISTGIAFVWGTLLVGVWSAPSLSADTLVPMFGREVIGWALFCILGSTVLTYLANNWALRHTNSSRVALYIYVQPLVATSLSISLGRDEPDVRFAIAAGLVFTGVFLDVVLAGRSRRKT